MSYQKTKNFMNTELNNYLETNMKEIRDLELIPFEVSNCELALKNYVLFAKCKENILIFLSKKFLHVSLDYLSKNDYTYAVRFLDEDSYNNLYKKSLEFKTDKQMQNVHAEQDRIETSDEDFNMSEFLQINSDILNSEDSAPIIKFVNSLFYQALKKKASDIHIETHEYKSEVRYRVNGVLEKHLDLDKNVMALIISRIKVISNLDISEKRIPQDGRTQVTISSKTLDIRVSVLPTFYGEKVVMRLLMQSDDIPSLDELGFKRNTIANLERLLTNSYGMILVSGPTGSGKSTTLHSILQKIESPEKNITTIEDPVEYKTDKINQIQVNHKVGLTFATGLRSVLRQDPDVIMLGEIRDKETASIAIQAALTGHLMFSTIHTNRAVAGISRLIDMGIEKFLISSSLLAIISQRLIRILCNHCKEVDLRENVFINDFNLHKDVTLYKGVGCKLCNDSGYSKRVAIEELFVLDKDIRDYIKHEINDDKLFEIAKKNGMVSLEEQIKTMLINGETTLEEALRVGVK